MSREDRPRHCGVPGQDLECVECGVRLYGQDVEAVCRRKGGSEAVTKKRKRSEVEWLRTERAVYGGCCDRFANNQGCDCYDLAEPDHPELEAQIKRMQAKLDALQKEAVAFKKQPLEAQAVRTLPYDEVRQLVIEIRRYAIYHGCTIGECVAWGKLKELTGVGQDYDCPSARPN